MKHMHANPLVSYTLPIYNGTKMPTPIPGVHFLNTTRVTHHASGKINYEQHSVPSCGWGPFLEIMQEASRQIAQGTFP